MVLSENNEPFIEKKPSGNGPDSTKDQIPDSSVQGSNPGERLRSIEMAASRKIADTPKMNFIHFFNHIKNFKVKLTPFFQKYRGAFSIAFNIFLLIVILLLGKQVFTLKKMIVGDVMGALYMNLEELDKSVISSQITIEDTVQLDFPLQVNQKTDLVLTDDTVINGARITISTGALTITGAPASIVLPAGTILPVQLNLEIPVDASAPLDLNSSINIPLAETDLHRPLTNMQNIIEPQIISYMDGATSWQDIPACKIFGFFCKWWFK